MVLLEKQGNVPSHAIAFGRPASQVGSILREYYSVRSYSQLTTKERTTRTVTTDRATTWDCLYPLTVCVCCKCIGLAHCCSNNSETSKQTSRARIFVGLWWIKKGCSKAPQTFGEFPNQNRNDSVWFGHRCATKETYWVSPDHNSKTIFVLLQ